MFKKSTKFTSVILSAALLTTMTSTSLAAPVHQGDACSQDYSVQADDWLSKVSEKFYGDPLAYQTIVEATNTVNQADSSYASIANADLIEIGWKLCIPEAADGMMMAADEAMMADDEAMMADDEAMMADEMMMEGQANFNVLVENIGDFAYRSSGVFNTPVGASEPGPLLPGGAYEFSFNAAPGDRLSFATMFVQSNDLFIGPDQAGIALFNEDGSPLTGDITDQILLWDSGTELNQEPGVGVDQALNQAGPDTGAADSDNTVRVADNEFGNLPAVDEVVRVSLDSPSANEFVLRIDSITDGPILATSDGGTVPTPFAPGVWVVHTADSPLFSTGAPDLGLGLEALAEDGNPANLAEALAAQSGVTSPLAPGVWVIHAAADPLFTSGQTDRGLGLAALAEDGNPADLAEALAGMADLTSSGAFNTPVGSDGPGPLLPGAAYEFNFDAAPGDNLSFATMFVQSNDLFFGPDGAGIALFSADGSPISGDITDQILLWDAGSEVNQLPGIGSEQAPRQNGPNTGAEENGPVQIVADGYSYPDTGAVIRVTITAAK